MRLSNTEITFIKNSLNQFITDYQLYLFGSRTDPNKKGGDIDLLLTVKNKPEILAAKHKILAEIKSAIGDQKIDLVIAHEEELKKDPFLLEVMETAVKLV